MWDFNIEFTLIEVIFWYKIHALIWLLDYHQHQPCGWWVNPILSSLVLACFLMNPTLHIKHDKRWNIQNFTESLAFWSPSLLIPYHDKTWVCCKSCETHWCYVKLRAETLHCLLPQPQPQAVMVTSWLYSRTLKTVHPYTQTLLELSITKEIVQKVFLITQMNKSNC